MNMPAGEHERVPLPTLRCLLEGDGHEVQTVADCAAVRARFERYRQEVRLAQHMFDSVIRRSPADIEFLRQWMVTTGHFSGDLLIYERTPDGHLHILMGDFTGHGLAAAVGALPAADIFFAMTRKGMALCDIAGEINRKLNELLPTGRFCAAILARVSPRHDELELWNGGQPPLLLLDADGHLAAEFPSFHLPLGVAAPPGFDGATKTVALAGIRHVVLYSDGLIEARNAAGAMFGAEGLQDAIVVARDESAHPYQNIKARVVSFLDGMEPHDDVSLLTLDVAARA